MSVNGEREDAVDDPVVAQEQHERDDRHHRVDDQQNAQSERRDPADQHEPSGRMRVEFVYRRC